MLEHGFTKSDAVVEVHPLKTPPGGEDVSAFSAVLTNRLMFQEADTSCILSPACSSVLWDLVFQCICGSNGDSLSNFARCDWQHT